MPESVEPWLRGTHSDLDAVRRQVLHALELTGEDVTQWCASLNDAEMNARPFSLPPVAFHLRHITHSLDRLLTYANGHPLTDLQLDALHSEMNSEAMAAQLLSEVHTALASAAGRVRRTPPGTYEQPRGVGRALLPTTVGGLLIHCAEHTQRHSGQAVTTAKILLALRSAVPQRK